jgi:hypothetical protein
MVDVAPTIRTFAFWVWGTETGKRVEKRNLKEQRLHRSPLVEGLVKVVMRRIGDEGAEDQFLILATRGDRSGKSHGALRETLGDSGLVCSPEVPRIQP